VIWDGVDLSAREKEVRGCYRLVFSHQFNVEDLQAGVCKMEYELSNPCGLTYELLKKSRITIPKPN
jgi:hypothetical protein